MAELCDRYRLSVCLSVCLYVCLSVILSVSRITDERVYGRRPTLVGMASGRPL